MVAGADEDWGGVPGFKLFGQPDSVLVLLARTLPPIGIIFAIYMTWAGADVPGGAFQGGTVLAAMWILVMVAGRARVPRVVLAAAAAGHRGGARRVPRDRLCGLPRARPVPRLSRRAIAKPLIVVMEFALTLSIGVILGLLVAGPPQGEGAP